jgi:hypothetical protein
METVHGFDFFPLEFDRDGALAGQAAWDELRRHVSASGTTDVVALAHGFRNDANDARRLYEEFLQNLRANLERPEFAALRDRVASRRPGCSGPRRRSANRSATRTGGVQSAGADADLALVMGELAELSRDAESDEERAAMAEALGLLPRLEDDPDNQDRFVELVLSTVHEGEPDPTEGLPQVRSQAGSELLQKLQLPVVLPHVAASDDEGGVAAIGASAAAADGSALGVGSFVGSIAGRVGNFLNMATWYRMKERSGTVGARGVATCLRELRAQMPGIRIHLVGHSLGGRLVAACAKALAQHRPRTQVDSLYLLQAAFSHYGFSRDNLAGVPGFFRPVIDGAVVRGPMLATFSFQDEVVGKAYAIASRLAGDNVKAVGDASDPYGGIGRNGAQNLDEMASEGLHAVGDPYTFASRRLVCLDGSGGLITNHSDVRNPRVTYAFASMLAAT